MRAYKQELELIANDILNQNADAKKLAINYNEKVFKQ